MIDFKQQILDYLQSREDPVKIKSIQRVLGFANSERQLARNLLSELVKEGKVVRDGVRYWVPHGKQVSLEIKRQKTRAKSQLIGRLMVNRKGDGFVANPRGTDWMVPRKMMMDARHGDIVVAHMVERGRGGRVIAEVIEIQSYGTTVLVGIFERHGADIWFTPFGDGRVERHQLHDFPENAEEDMVGRFTREGSSKWRFAGFLGNMNDPEVDEAIVLAEGQIEEDFPPEALDSIAALSEFAFDPSDREDFRDRLVFTVDGETARDFDDALHFHPCEDGQIEVGIHIADVSHFVTPESPLDMVARDRGNSVYLPHKAIPMLPERLSTDLCSLNPGVPRYTLSVICMMDAEGEVQSFRVAKGIIQSAYRLTYNLVAGMGITKDEALRTEYAEVLPAVEIALDLSRKMKDRRNKAGGLQLDMPEMRAVLDEEMALKEVVPTQQNDANRMIEAFMCLANECVARYMTELEIAIPFRIHDQPDAQKLENLSNFWSARGFEAPVDIAGNPAKALNQMIEKLRSMPAGGDILQLQVLKSLKLAEYSIENHGHFGLASTHYAHFTSPIRRYADLVVHQRITRLLRLKDPSPEHFNDDDLEATCSHISERERAASRAEQTFMALKQLRLMMNMVGDSFDGVIVEIKPFGVFVRTEPWFVTGLIHLDNLTDDYYEVNEESLALVGRRGRVFRVGDPMRVRVDMVDLLARRVNLVPEKMPDRKPRFRFDKPKPKGKIKRHPGPPRKKRRRR